MAKVDPYLRPLFDAMNDMLDPERVTAHLEKGVIEVAPLAFMRGRAQPVEQPVLTPDGWQPIGSACASATSWSAPTVGRRRCSASTRRAASRSSACAPGRCSTLCCAEHLWTVGRLTTVAAASAARPARRDEMIGRDARPPSAPLRAAAVSRTGGVRARDVPMDPYALGLLLGDGCLTTKTTPTFTTGDPN